MDKLKLHTPNLTQDNMARIRDLFPNCVTEAKGKDGQTSLAVDFDLLRQELSESIVEGPQERYQLNWPGKREALLTANAPIAKTLRPCRDESVDFETTKNLYIEGDNLDALKLLQETYLGKVKMIYIDPPYNTGNDFIYEDDFAENTEEFLKRSNQKDGEGNRLIANPESNGRFHSDWLSMMYPRLKLARNLLMENGVIFISIDDNEVAQLRKICDEIFGASNFEGHIHWRRRHNQPNDNTKMIGLVAEHIIVYAKNSNFLRTVGVGKIDLTGIFSNPDNDPRGDWASKPWKAGSDQSGSRYTITTPTGIVLDDEWMGEEATYHHLIVDNRIIFPRSGDGMPRKKYFKYEREEEGQCATNWWDSTQFGNNQGANNCMTSLFGLKNIFNNPKPVELLRGLLQIGNVKSGDIVLDFFSGSATFAHAVMQLNAERQTAIHYVLVQLPENLDDSLSNSSGKTKAKIKISIDFLASICKAHTICEIGKERIRRAGAKIKAELEQKVSQREQDSVLEGCSTRATPLDIGFRVLKVDSSNMANVYYTPDTLSQSMLDMMTDNVKEGRTPEDLLFQVLLDWGVDLTLPISKEIIQGKTVFFVDENALVACFDTGITEGLVKELTRFAPLRAVFRDNGFASDAVKINATQIFKQLSPSTEVKAI